MKNVWKLQTYGASKYIFIYPVVTKIVISGSESNQNSVREDKSYNMELVIL